MDEVGTGWPAGRLPDFACTAWLGEGNRFHGRFLVLTLEEVIGRVLSLIFFRENKRTGLQFCIEHPCPFILPGRSIELISRLSIQ